MTDSSVRRGLAPLHAGALLREDVLPTLDRPASEIAKLLRVSRQTLHTLLREEQPVTPAMALRLGKLCGNGPELWLTLQAKHDLDQLGREMLPTSPRFPPSTPPELLKAGVSPHSPPITPQTAAAPPSASPAAASAPRPR